MSRTLISSIVKELQKDGGITHPVFIAPSNRGAYELEPRDTGSKGMELVLLSSIALFFPVVGFSHV